MWELVGAHGLVRAVGREAATNARELGGRIRAEELSGEDYLLSERIGLTVVADEAVSVQLLCQRAKLVVLEITWEHLVCVWGGAKASTKPGPSGAALATKSAHGTEAEQYKGS